MTAKLLKRSGKTIDWNNVLCAECGHTFPYSGGVRAPWVGLPGVRMVLCSRECAEDWMEGDHEG